MCLCKYSYDRRMEIPSSAKQICYDQFSVGVEDLSVSNLSLVLQASCYSYQSDLLSTVKPPISEHFGADRKCSLTGGQFTDRCIILYGQYIEHTNILLYNTNHFFF